MICHLLARRPPREEAQHRRHVERRSPAVPSASTHWILSLGDFALRHYPANVTVPGFRALAQAHAVETLIQCCRAHCIAPIVQLHRMLVDVARELRLRAVANGSTSRHR
jgi:hypothetical protein